VAFALGAALALFAGESRAVLVEKVVAVVGDQAIFLSDLHDRSIPYLRQIVKQVPPGAQRAAAESQMNKDLLNKMIEEELEAQAAERAKIKVTAEDIDNALKTIAAQREMTVPQLVAYNQERSGMTEQDYREELGRQVLEGKMLNLRVRGRIRITEEELRSTYVQSLREERAQLEYHPAWIVLRILPDSSDAAVAERRALAAEIAERARKGEDFAAMARKYSDDSSTKDRGGDLGIRAPMKTVAAQSGRRPILAAELEDVVMKLEPGDVTDPIEIGDAIGVIKLVSRQPSHYTSFDAAREEMIARLQNDLLAKEKAQWIEELKRHTHVDPRM
jgi:peptidyl-prolyl cis-trans isomerase SurA